jgi:hypothetical protein
VESRNSHSSEQSGAKVTVLCDALSGRRIYYPELFIKATQGPATTFDEALALTDFLERQPQSIVTANVNYRTADIPAVKTADIFIALRQLLKTNLDLTLPQI